MTTGNGGSPLRKLPQRSRYVRLRSQFGDESLDLALAPMPRPPDEHLEVVGPQVRREQPQGAEIQSPFSQ